MGRRLKLRTEPHTFELGGVTFEAWPAGQFQRDLAETNARNAARQLSQAGQLAESYAMPAGMVSKIVAGSLDFAEECDIDVGELNQLAGYGTHLFAVELGVIVIKSWQGVDDESGQPIAPSRKAISALFLDVVEPGKPKTMAIGFLEEVMTLTALEEQEGNG
jgi:hypothetical protein